MRATLMGIVTGIPILLFFWVFNHANVVYHLCFRDVPNFWLAAFSYMAGAFCFGVAAWRIGREGAKAW